MKQWISDYVRAQQAALDSIPAAAVAKSLRKPSRGDSENFREQVAASGAM